MIERSSISHIAPPLSESRASAGRAHACTDAAVVAMISVVVVKTGSAPRSLSANGRGGGRRSWVRRGIQNATSSPSKRPSCPSWHERSVWRGSLSSS